MKKIFLALIFTMFGAFFGVSAYADSPETMWQGDQILRQQSVEEGLDRQRGRDAVDYFFSCLPITEYGDSVYPDTYGGYRFDDNGDLVIQVNASDLSEYLFLQEEFPCIVFEQVEYSLNYLLELRDEYMDAYDPETETVYGGGIDMENNCAYIDVDEETLSRKTNVPGSPLVFRLGFPIEFDLPPVEDVLFDSDKSDVEPVDEEEICDSMDPSAKSNPTVVKGGQTLNIYKPDGDGVGKISAGIGCTTSSGKNGLVACGHGMSVNDTVKLDNDEIGRVTFVQYSSDGLGDYCIITLNDDFTADGATYSLPNTIRYNHSVHEPKLGDKLFEYTINSGLTKVIVNDTHYKTTYTLNGVKVTLKEMFKAKITSGVSALGNSGTGIYHNSRDDDYTSFLEFSGIQSGAGGNDPVTGIPSYIIFTPLKYIQNCTIVQF